MFRPLLYCYIPSNILCFHYRNYDAPEFYDKTVPDPDSRPTVLLCPDCPGNTPSEQSCISDTAGVMGILCTLILLIPINLIVHHLTGLPTLSAILPVLGAILLILISMALTFIAGLIPSGMAAKKDPVVALRTE